MPHRPLTPLCRRVDVVAKHLGALREQEKRIRGLEAQVGPTAPVPDPPPHPRHLRDRCLPWGGPCTAPRHPLSPQRGPQPPARSLLCRGRTLGTRGPGKRGVTDRRVPRRPLFPESWAAAEGFPGHLSLAQVDYCVVLLSSLADRLAPGTALRGECGSG